MMISLGRGEKTEKADNHPSAFVRSGGKGSADTSAADTESGDAKTKSCNKTGTGDP